MRYLSVCSGMEAASVAWHPLGWKPVGFSEIEPFPCAILKHRFPNVPNYGSLTEYQSWPLEPGAIDLLVGGTPCQSFSVAGLRKGLADPRGNLALTFLGLADKLKPRWIVWENVPGVLSSGGGRDFGSFLGALVELGYGFAYRVLDAQYFGVPQRRRRVFVVACLGDWRAAAEVLSLREGLRGYLETGNKKRKGVASDAGASVEAKGQYYDFQAIGTIRANGGDLGGGSEGLVVKPMTVRRLSTNECYRLQGFPDNWGRIPWKGKPASECPDGPQYKAAGNSMAVPCMFWIGNRIAQHEAKA
jgi:DNA (cytosine-5)-methyltransferase 1